MPSFAGKMRGSRIPHLRGIPGSRSWCEVCGTDHGRAEDCPGELPVTGPERHEFRIYVGTPQGIEEIGVLLAPCGDRWRSRVLTYPNILWTIPGGRASLKFIGQSSEEAEGRAVAFIHEHCLALGYPLRDQLEKVDAAASASGVGRTVRISDDLTKRKSRALHLFYGPGRPNHRGVTVNLSHQGMFIATPSPHEPGVPLRIRMKLEDGVAQLGGVVVWKRIRPVSGRPAGMGVRLLEVPTVYSRFVHALP